MKIRCGVRGPNVAISRQVVVKRLFLASTAGLLCLFSFDLASPASTWVDEKLEQYSARPAWIATRCENMSKVNQKGESVFDRKVAMLEKQYNPNFAQKSAAEILEFYHLFVRKFCQSVW